MSFVFTGAVEGIFDEAMARRLVAEVGAEMATVYGKRRKAALLHKLRGYNAAAEHSPWFVLVDLDRDADCAPPARERWLPQPASSMCFRISVRAAETWLLADRERFARFLGVRVAALPRLLIEVALPLEAIHRESAGEKSIRHGHPSTLHPWWARRPAARRSSPRSSKTPPQRRIPSAR